MKSAPDVAQTFGVESIWFRGTQFDSNKPPVFEMQSCLPACLLLR